MGHLSGEEVLTCFKPKSSSEKEQTGATNFWLYAQCGLVRAARWCRWMKIQPALYDVNGWSIQAKIKRTRSFYLTRWLWLQTIHQNLVWKTRICGRSLGTTYFAIGRVVVSPMWEIPLFLPYLFFKQRFIFSLALHFRGQSCKTSLDILSAPDKVHLWDSHDKLLQVFNIATNQGRW